MAGWRAGALIVLLMLTVVALRGYLPGVPVPPPRDSPAGGGSPVVLLLLVESTALLILLGVVGRRRRRRRPREREHRRGRRITWREAVVAAAIVLVGVVALGAPLLLGHPADQPDRRDRAPGTAQRPPADRTTTPPPGGPVADPPSDTPFVVAAAVLLVGIAALGTVVLARGRAPTAAEPEEVPDDPRPPPEVAGGLARAAELGLAEVAEPGRDPRAAIIACYTAMERGLAEAPDAAPLASDTPSEVLARAVGHGALRSAGAAPLVDLFTEARFSPHRMTEAHRESAVRWLGAVLDDLRSRR